MKKNKLYLVFIFLFVIPFLMVSETSMDLYQKGKIAYFNEDYESAVYYFKQSLEKNPNYLEPLIDISNLYYELENYDYAYKYLNKAMSLSSHDKDLMIFSADIETELSLFDRAEKKYKMIISENPLNTKALNGLAKLYLKNNKKILAKKTLDDVLKTEPSNFQALLLTSFYYEDINIEKANQYYQMNIENNSINPETFYYYSLFNFRNKETTEAIENIKSAISIKDKIKYKKVYGKYLLFINTPDLALRIFQDILKKEKDNYLIYYYIAYSYLMLSDFDNAVKSLKMALILRNDDEVSEYLLNNILIDNYEVDNKDRIERSDYYMDRALKAKKESQYDLYVFFLKEAIRLYPKIIDARLELADYFLLQKLPERYIRELQVAYKYSKDKKLSEKIDMENKRISYRLGDDWNINQYHINRDLYTIPIFIDSEISNQHYNIEKIFLKIFQNIFLQDIKFETKMYDDKNYNIAERLKISKEIESPFYINTKIIENSTSVNIQLTLINSLNNETINKFGTIKNGNDRFVNAAYNVQKKLNESIIFKAHIIKISKDRAIINAGRQSGIKLKDNFVILKKKSYPIEFNRSNFIYDVGDIKGYGIAVKVDENIAEIKFSDDDFFKDVDIDDIIIYKK